jgi:peroxiredoxin
VTIKEGIQTGKAYLKYYTDKGPYTDSVRFSKGKFVLEGFVPDKQTIAKLSLFSEKENTSTHENSCEVWLEEGDIYISSKTKLINATYSGSDIQKEFSELQSKLIPVKMKSFILDQAYEKAEADNDAEGKDKLLNVDYPELFKEKQTILGDFIRKYPLSLITAFKFEEFTGDGEIDLTIVEPVYNLLDDRIKQHTSVMSAAERIAIYKRTAPGMDALEFSQTDTSGNKISLVSFRGKYLLIEFWAGWCVPCRAENPMLRRMYERYNKRGFEILGVSLDGERKRWTNAIRTDQLMWKQVSDLQVFENAIAKLYGVTSIPQNILISPDGKIIAKNLKGNALQNKLFEIFK